MKDYETVVNYALLWSVADNCWVDSGVRPHCPTAAPGDACGSQMTVWDAGGRSAETCTREAGHPGPHVVHAQPGLPILAWLVKR